MIRMSHALSLLLLFPAATLAQAENPAARPVTFDKGIVSGLGARNIGSAAMSGRIAAVAARNTEDGKVELFIGSASGGVWKSQDGGTTFKPVFDKQTVQSIGALAIDPTDPRVVWAGSGEAWTRNSVSVGNGIYKSTDGGETWKNMGLPESERITRIVVHPKNGKVVFACVPGKLWSDSAERGLYRTTDGGESWSQVLKGKNLSTGCSSLSLDPSNPDVMLAALWDFRRKGWTFRSGGDGPESESGSGLHRSTDGGATWKEIAPESGKGLPAKPWGRLEVVHAPSEAKRVYLFVESADSGLYVSDDGGSSWEERDKSQMMVWRPFYFARMVVDPTNPDRVFKMNLNLIVSDDAGKTFNSAGGGSHGDWHDLWVNPKNPKHVIGGDDGGLWISHDGGNRWWKCENLPISQFYHVAVDDQFPYRVYGGLQDNGSWTSLSTYPGGVSNANWDVVYYGDGFWVIPDPTDPDSLYAESQGGYIAHMNRKTRLARDIQPKALYKEKLRFNWNTPIHASSAEPGTIYLGSQFLFRTRDKGQTWERISPDLTTNDPAKQKQEESGGVTVDNSAAEMHTTIFSISSSPKSGKVVWVGTDDGNVQVTRDGGATWTNVTANMKEAPAGRWISSVEASRFDEGTAYVTVDSHTFGDMTPHAYRTTDFGKSWASIVSASQGVRGYAHVVKEDSVKKELLFLGTEFGLWLSVDGGKRWAEFKGGDLPCVSVRDLAVQTREGDLVLATHGRGIWVVDDLSPLRDLSDEILSRDAAFLASRPTEQLLSGMGSFVLGDNSYVGPSAPGGAVVAYYQKTRHLFGPLKLEILDESGKVIDTIPASKRRGINRVSWSMRLPPPRVPRAAQVAFGASQGPRVVPGKYTVRLTKGDKVYETKLDIRVDRRASYGVEDRKAANEAVLRVQALFGRMTDIAGRIEMVQAMSQQTGAQLPEGDALGAEVAALAAKAGEIRKKIVATKEGGAITGEERIREHTETLYGAIMSYEGKPGPYHLERVDALSKELDDVEKELQAFLEKDLPALNEKLKGKGLPPIELPPATAALQEERGYPTLDEGQVRALGAAGLMETSTIAREERD